MAKPIQLAGPDKACPDKDCHAAMTLLKCATLVVADAGAACERYARWMDYAVVERGAVPADLAASWGTPASTGREYAVLQPASGEPVFLRFVAGDPVPGYRPIRTFGWAATELCVTDVEAVNARMAQSPFAVIGPPKPLDGYATIKPMQVRGPDAEVVYLTQILVDDPASGLPRPRSLVDRPFIMVHACADLAAGIGWAREVLGLEVIDPVSLRYSMINLAFGQDEDAQTAIVTARYGDHTFLELDQYPAAATARPRHSGALPPGVAIVSMLHPDMARLGGHWLAEPVVRDGAVYGGRASGVVLTPDGAILEVIDAS
jgi:catechol 2,3-dioxygenase-like lactoylglutathione lyase family enzyme